MSRPTRISRALANRTPEVQAQPFSPQARLCSFSYCRSGLRTRNCSVRIPSDCLKTGIGPSLQTCLSSGKLPSRRCRALPQLPRLANGAWPIAPSTSTVEHESVSVMVVQAMRSYMVRFYQWSRFSDFEQVMQLAWPSISAARQVLTNTRENPPLDLLCTAATAATTTTRPRIH